jgi:hypothetical protein
LYIVVSLLSLFGFVVLVFTTGNAFVAGLILTYPASNGNLLPPGAFAAEEFHKPL